MILTTVGTEKFPFNRLMQWVNLLIETEAIEEEILCQYGSCTFLPPGVKVYSLLPEKKFRQAIDEARLIISHCGEGTLNILDGSGKPYILVPRTYQFGEHVDNHQIELASALEEQGIPIAWSPGDLVRFLAQPTRGFLPSSSVAKVCRMLSEHFPENSHA